MAATASSSEEAGTGGDVPPRVWLVTGDKLGDNAQVEIIAETLGWPYERKQLYFQEPYIIGKPRFKADLHHIDTTRSDPLEPPWPDLVITVGRRPSMAALWIRKQSGRRTKIVLLGRPKRFFDQFGLVVASGQYQLPDRPNVLRLDLPLMRIDEAAIATAALEWQQRLGNVRRPLIALLVGGPTKPFIMNAEVAGQLIDQAGRLASEAGGTLYITTSRRTPPAVVETLQTRLPANGILYRWEAGRTDNPYRGLLALADCFIVTGDSISMMVEVARLGKPLAIFGLRTNPGIVSTLWQRLARLLHPPAGEEKAGGSLQALGNFLYRIGLVGYSRDLPALHRLLFRRGLAVPLGDPFPAQTRRAADELPRVVERIKGLMADN